VGTLDGVSEPAPTLSIDTRGDSPRAIALVLHGGQERSRRSVRPWNLPALRMVPFARRIAARGDGQIAVARLRYAVRGWNGADRSPVADARWAIEQLLDQLGGLPIGLVGHSMGGRVALQVAGHPNVRSVVALAPWVEVGDPVSQLAGREVLLVHGTDDRMTSPRATAGLADRLKGQGVPVTLVHRLGEHHAMLRKADEWHELAAEFTCRALLARPGPVRGDAATFEEEPT
jgi:dienelactone hydrolase